MAQEVIAVFQPEDVGRARETAKRFAVQLGFDDTASQEIAIAVSELASNLIKHARGGHLNLASSAADERPGLCLESHDSGPGIPDVERAVTDGFSTTGSLGYGLGTVNRLMDEFQVTSQPGHGTSILCKRWLRRDALPMTPFPLEFGVATRPYPGMEVNGDAFVIKRWESHALVGVIDGLGHGPLAYRASETARQYVETHYDLPLDMLFRGVAQTCHSTRGVVMALARFDFGYPLADFQLKEPQLPGSIPEAGISGFKLSFASIGNIEVRVLSATKPMNFMVRRGVLGGSAPNAVVTEHAWNPADLLLLHSDGLRTHWVWQDFPDLQVLSAEQVARQLLNALAKEEDDATLLVVKGRA